MTALGIPLRRLVLYGCAMLALVGLNALRFLERPGQQGTAPIETGGNLPELSPLTLTSEVTGFASPPTRDLFREDAQEPPPPPAPPAPPPEPAPDPNARARSQAESSLDSIRIIGFLSTTEGMIAVMSLGGDVINAFAGDTPLPGFVVSDVTIDSVTVTHRDLGISRTYGLQDAE